MTNPPGTPEHDGLGPPPPLFQIGGRKRFGEGKSGSRWIMLIVVAVLALIVINVGIGLYADLLWFDSLGYQDVYLKRIVSQLILFFIGAGIFLAFFWGNTLLARRNLRNTEAMSLAEQLDVGPTAIRVTIIALSLFLAVIFGGAAGGRWQTFLLWFEGHTFGVSDPQFGRDVGFYVFTLPALNFIQGWLLGVLVITLLATLVMYGLAVRLERGIPIAVPSGARAHLSILVAAGLLLFAFRHWLAPFDYTLRQAGGVFGVGYVDAHARIPLQYALVVLAILAALITVASIRRRGVELPAGAIGVWLFVSIVVANGYPAVLQRLVVEPDELTKEGQYIAENIEATRRSFALDGIVEQQYAADARLTPAELDTHRATIADIRLWDPRVIRDTYSELQALRPLYVFNDVDVDRYDLGSDGRRQVMLSARELSHQRLAADAQGWVNRHLQFTHGYGVVMSPVNEVTATGQPQLLLQDIPIRGVLEVDRPEIYFGELTNTYAIVNTKEQEFDHPDGSNNVYTTYQAESGVALSSILRRITYAWEFADANILISGALTSESRLLYRRDIRARVSEIAPFLGLDRDPYLIVAGGKLYWMIDAYTTTDRYPYSQRTSGGYNYIRNSVKVTVDTYTGETALYLADPTDPIAAAWAGIFPDLFLPLDEMSAELRDHVRYPEGLFRPQAEMYLTYHMTDTKVFYNREDLWTIPLEKLRDRDIPVEPYYVTLQLPGFDRPEFVLILPFSAANRNNAVALLAARSDGENYGKTLALRFPTDDLVPGPRQVEARIDQDDLVSQQLTLWNQTGSEVLRGNLLLVPVGSSYIYVEPLYLQAASLPFPELRRVVVIANGQIAMEPTLELALQVIFGERAPTRPEGADPGGTPVVTPTPAGTPQPAVPASPGATPDSIAGLIETANAAYDRAQDRLRQGDLAGYQREIDEVARILRQLASSTP